MHDFRRLKSDLTREGRITESRCAVLLAALHVGIESVPPATMTSGHVHHDLTASAIRRGLREVN